MTLIERENGCEGEDLGRGVRAEVVEDMIYT